jgi:hypothetical protein
MANPSPNLANLRPFPKDVSGYPGGKLVHARNCLSNGFLNALADDFDRYREGAIRRCREQSPARYLAIVATLMPKELKVEQGGEAVWVER